MGDRLFITAIFLACALAVVVVLFMGIGKFQLCKFYFPEMNRAACFFTQLPAVTPRRP